MSDRPANITSRSSLHCRMGESPNRCRRRFSGWHIGRWNQAWRAEKRRAKKIERALYSELADVYDRVYGMTNELTSSDDGDADYRLVAAILKSIKTEAHQYAKSNPDVFYDLSCALEIDNMYRQLHQAQTLPNLGDRTVLIVASAFPYLLRRAIMCKIINVELFKQASGTTYSRILEHIEKDKEDEKE